MNRNPLSAPTIPHKPVCFGVVFWHPMLAPQVDGCHAALGFRAAPSGCSGVPAYRFPPVYGQAQRSGLECAGEAHHGAQVPAKSFRRGSVRERTDQYRH